MRKAEPDQHSDRDETEGNAEESDRFGELPTIEKFKEIRKNILQNKRESFRHIFYLPTIK